MAILGRYFAGSERYAIEFLCNYDMISVIGSDIVTREVSGKSKLNDDG